MTIQSEADALDALAAVLAWAREAPTSTHGGARTGITYQRDRIIASDVIADGTIGVSTYATPKDAMEKAADMERAYHTWLRLAGRR